MTHSPSSTKYRAEQRRVIAGTTIGTAIEWYDFFLYAQVAGIVFNTIMFSEDMPAGVRTIIAFLTVGISFLFRPLGAFLAGHFADRLGRRVVLMITLMTMGLATTLIGLLPTYETIGIGAPILLLALRIIQGISAGGEWGSAVLLAVEHAPAHRRGLFGAGPQIGTPAGLLLASGAMTIMNLIAPGDAFVEWGWRVPFLFSFVLVLVGVFIRHGVEESPIYAEMTDRPDVVKDPRPVATLFGRYGAVLVAAAFIIAGNGAVGYMTVGGFIQAHAIQPEGLAMDRGQVLAAVTLSAFTWLMTTLATGWFSDLFGRRNVTIVGFLVQAIGVVALFPLVDTGSLRWLTVALVFLTLGLGMTYGQLSSLYAEVFPASIRGSGTSITYAVGSILGGAFAPMIAAALVNATGGTRAVTAYLLGMTFLGLIGATVLRDRTRIPLGSDYEAIQRGSHFLWQPDWRPAAAQLAAELDEKNKVLVGDRA
ncbi:MFS transporter [Corynebacterium uterequi]|uniref:Arabinose efflux permease family protein n=1 Tax=Corynebacterium uterequi TaxID=1072256 RepID=A0A0G3HEF4_9CORY|nr:MFS transporter [Corynebacterium uterequi]AKK11659.1 arabinose efflux permease family protein [Corynebacterium uterequi]